MNKRDLITLAVVSTFLVACVKESAVPEPIEPEVSKVSRFGEYEGYSEERFNEWVRQSQYIESFDGTKIAIDVVRPAVDGIAVAEPLPVVWTHSRYQRNPTGGARQAIERQRAEAISGGEDPEALGLPDTGPGFAMSNVERNETLQRLVKHGYVVASVAVRGSGASYGRYEGVFSSAETKDAFEVIDWLAKQPWSDGNIGMYGASYLGITQYAAIGTQHPALKAVVPGEALLDLYDFSHIGGVYKTDFMDAWTEGVVALDTVVVPSTVDEDPEGVMLKQARIEHEHNWKAWEEWGAAPYRDHDSESMSWYRMGPTAAIDTITNSDVAVYHWSGWYDLFANHGPLWFVNYLGPDKWTMGPWSHGNSFESVDKERSRIHAAEHHRWFDHWLKNIDNGIMDGPAINYAIIDTPGEEWSWKSSDEFPIPGTKNTNFYLSSGASGSIESVNDGALETVLPESEFLQEYKVDLSTTTGTATRWDNGGGPRMVYPDMRDNDRKSLTYTTAPLQDDLTAIGYPVVILTAGASGSDADFYVLIHEIQADGYSQYISEGVLRASLRKLGTPPWSNNLNLPWPRAHAEDIDPLEPGELVELQIQMQPLSYLFNKGNRIRVTIMGADADNTEAPPDPNATLKIQLGGESASRIILPIVATTRRQ